MSADLISVLEIIGAIVFGLLIMPVLGGAYVRYVHYIMEHTVNKPYKSKDETNNG